MAFPLMLAVFLATFVVAAITVVIGAAVLDQREKQNPVTLNLEQDAPPPAFLGDGQPALLRDQELTTISPLAKVIERLDFVAGLSHHISDADLNWSVGRVIGLMLLCGAIGFAIANSVSWPPFLAKVGFASFASLTPYLYILKKRSKRRALIQEQFPECVDTMARAMRAGHPFAGALDLAASQTAAPLGRELRKTFAEGAFGMPWEQALENFGKRVRLQEVSIFVAAVQIQTRTGGNLSEVLDKLSENMREGAAVRGEVQSFSNQGRLAGKILTVLPIVIAVMMFLVNPTFLLPLVDETIGRYMLSGAIAGLVVAHFVIQKLVDIRL